MAKKQLTTADDILSLVSLAKIIEVDDAPGVDGVFLMRTLSARERDDYELYALDSEGGIDMAKIRGYRARLLALTLVDGDGKRIFANGKADKLDELPAPIILHLYNKAEQFNGLGEYADVKDVEGALKKA